MPTRCHHCGGRLDDSDSTSWGGWTLDERAREIRAEEKVVRLTNKGTAIVSVLLRAQGRTVGKDALFTQVWGNGDDLSDFTKIADVTLCKLRQLFTLSGFPHAIGTKWANGWYFKPVAEAVQATRVEQGKRQRHLYHE